MPQETKSGTNDPVAAFLHFSEQPSLQGLAATAADERALVDALEKAFDYRGDVTLTLAGGEVVSGYIFDRRAGSSLEGSTVRLLPPDTDAKRTVRFSEIAKVEFTGKDAAHGKSYETWLRKYVEKKLKGEAANIESERLE